MHKVRQAIRKHRKLLSACAMVLAIALMFRAVHSPAIVGVSAAKRVLPIYSVQRDDRVVSLTFDAAWGNEDTQTLIDILGKYNVHATFFVVGEWVGKYPESVKALADAGNAGMDHARPEGSERRRDHLARAHARAAGQHRAVSQRGRAHAGGTGRHHRGAHRRRLHAPAGLADAPARRHTY